MNSINHDAGAGLSTKPKSKLYTGDELVAAINANRPGLGSYLRDQVRSEDVKPGFGWTSVTDAINHYKRGGDCPEPQWFRRQAVTAAIILILKENLA